MIPRRSTPRILLVMISATLASSLANPEPASKPLSDRILEGARREVGRKTIYKETYEVIAYPNGDVAPNIGVCTDLVIRSFRNAGIDLQQRLHEDRKAHPDAYPTDLWDYKKPDKNIDHRRCQNLYVFLKRHAKSLTIELDDAHRADWKGGDVVFFKREGKKYPWHVGIVSDERTPDGIPMVLHLFPPSARKDPLSDFLPIHSHFRWEECAARQTAERATPGRVFVTGPNPETRPPKPTATLATKPATR